MLFNSYIFVLAFLPIVLLVYFGLNHFGRYSFAKAWLIIASLFFYGYVTPWYLIIIVFSVLFNYISGYLMLNTISKPSPKKCIAVFSVLLNLGVLFYFKYYDFFIDNLNHVLHTSIGLLNLLLPLGISFFTFQQLSYVVDCYKGSVPRYSFLDYALFVTYFPQLIAGPIVLHNEIIPQFQDIERKCFNPDHMAAGLWAFSLGLGKKVLLADTFGLCVDYAFENIDSLGTFSTALSMLAYTFQIYFDFSGYSDMAVGIGKMMNIDIVQNFDSPYKAVNIVDFWKRWHITLTRFFTTYIYIPLGGNREGKYKTYRNIFIVFLLSGIWHGANWTFILWGILHGIANIVTRMINQKSDILQGKNRISKFCSWALTFAFVNLTWVIFRADSISEAFHFYRQLFNVSKLDIPSSITKLFRLDGFSLICKFIPFVGDYLAKYALIFFFVFATLILFRKKNTYQETQCFTPNLLKALFSVTIIVICIMSFAGVSSFLYWNF